MVIYYINLLIILALAYPLCIRQPTRVKKIIYLSVTFGFMFFLASARSGIGNDYMSYIDIYNKAGAASMGELFALPYEPGYLLLCKLLYTFGLNNVMMYVVMALLCLIPVAVFIYRYSPNIWLSTWLYVTLTFFYGTMNFVRQNIALSILLLGYPLLRKRKIWSAAAYVGVVLLACAFHKTSLIMLPILLVCYFPLNKWLGAAYAGAALILYLTSEYIVDFVTNYIYKAYKDIIYMNVGLALHFLIVPFLILAFILLARPMMKKQYEDANLIVNMILFSALIWLFITKHMVLERFSLYVYVYVLIGVPMACECFQPDAAKQQECARMKDEIKELKTQGKRDAKYKNLVHDYNVLSESLAMRRVYYWFIVAAVLVVTFIYNRFGMYDGTSGFHGVFPYSSMFEWLNALP